MIVLCLQDGLYIYKAQHKIKMQAPYSKTIQIFKVEEIEYEIGDKALLSMAVLVSCCLSMYKNSPHRPHRTLGKTFKLT